MSEFVIIGVSSDSLLLYRLQEDLQCEPDRRYRVELTTTGEEALSTLADSLGMGQEVPLLICDRHLPDMSEEELFVRVQKRCPETVKILLSEPGDTEAIETIARRVNLYRYLLKPWEGLDLRLTVREAIDRYVRERQLARRFHQLQTANTQLERIVLEKNTDLIAQNERLNQEIKIRLDAEKQLEMFFSHSLEGFFFMMLDRPVRWDDTVDKEAVLDYVFTHQRMTRVNDAMIAQYRTQRELLLGLTPADLFAHNIEYGRQVWRNFFDAGRLHIETDERRFDGTAIIIEGDYTCLYDEDGQIIGHFGIQRDVTRSRRSATELKQKTFELRAFSNGLEHLHRLQISQFSTREELFAEYIKTGREILDFCAGMIGQIDDRYYTVKSVQSDFSHIIPDLKIDVDTTFCIEVVRQRKTLTYPHIGEMEQFKNHPLYQALKLESYISTPIFVEGEIYGTLCFFSTEIRPQGFENYEREIIELMARSIGKFLSAYQTESALRESEERFRRAFEDAGIGMALVGLDGYWLKVNHSLCQMLGYEEEEFLQQHFREMTHPEDLPACIDYCQRLIAREIRTSYIEKRFIHKQGYPIWVLVHTSLLRDSHQRPLYLMTQIQNISDRKKVEEENRQNQQFLHSIIENIPDMIFVKDARDLRFVRLNKAGEELLGYSRAELIGKNDYDFFPTEEADFFTAKDRAVLESNTFMEIPEERVETAHQGTRILHTKKMPILDETGKPRYLVGISEDITAAKHLAEERQQQEQALAKRERYLAALVEIQRQLLTYREDPQQFYPEILALLGKTSECDRVYVFKNHHDGTGAHLTSQLAEWCAPGISPEIDNPELQNISYRHTLPRWEQVLSSGGVIQGFISTFPAPERDILEPQGIRSILVLPLIFKGQFWGFIGFDHCREEREWTSSEVSLLSVAASAISLSEERQRFEKELRQSETQNRAMLEAIPDLMLRVKRDGSCLDTIFPKGSERENFVWLDRHIAEILPEELLVRQLNYINQALATGELQVYEHEFLKNGQICYEEVRISACGEDEALIMVRDVSDRKYSDATIQASLQEKEILLKEIHHRVKNNLHIISNLLDLQSESIEDERLLTLFTDSQNRIQSMALIHEQLYQSRDLARVDFSQYISNLLQNLCCSYSDRSDRVRTVLDIEPLQLNLDTSIPCGLLINELVTNSFKHAFPEHRSGYIYIQIYQNSEKKLHLKVQDNGIGITPALNWQESSTLGLRLVRIFARQLRAEIHSNFEEGTSFSFSFHPLKY